MTVRWPNKNLERYGWCDAPCRILWSWSGAPERKDALCPVCKRALAQKPGPKAIGRHHIRNGKPIDISAAGANAEAKAS